MDEEELSFPFSVFRFQNSRIVGKRYGGRTTSLVEGKNLLCIIPLKIWRFGSGPAY